MNEHEHELITSDAIREENRLVAKYKQALYERAQLSAQRDNSYKEQDGEQYLVIKKEHFELAGGRLNYGGRSD